MTNARGWFEAQSFHNVDIAPEPRAKLPACASPDGHQFRHITDDIYRCEHCGLEDAR